MPVIKKALIEKYAADMPQASAYEIYLKMQQDDPNLYLQWPYTRKIVKAVRVKP